MKKTLLIMAAVMMAVTSGAQVGTLTIRSEGKGLAASSYQSRCFSLDTSSLLFEQNSSSINSRYELVRFDMDQEEQARVRYKRKMGRSYEYAFDNGDTVDMLISDLGYEETVSGLFHERRNGKTLQPIGEAVPLQTIDEKMGKGISFATLSPNKQLLVGLSVILREGQQAEVRVALYDRKLEEYWKTTARLTAFGPMLVTDSGEVIIAGCSQKKGTDETLYEVMVFDGEHDYTYSFSTLQKGRVSDLQLCGYHDGRISLFATISKEGHDSQNASQVDRLLSLCYDTKAKKLYSEVYALTDVERNRLCNEDDDSRAKDAVRFLQIENVATAADGHYDVLLAQRWMQFVDNMPVGRNTQGLMVVSVDPEGRIRQTYARRVNTTVSFNKDIMNQYKLMRASGGALLLFTQHASSAGRGAGESIKSFEPISDKAVLTALYVPDEGAIVEQNIPIEKFGIMETPVPLGNDTYMLFLRNKKKSKVGIFELTVGK